MKKIVLGALAALALPSSANAAVTYLDFEGIQAYPGGNSVLIGGYYNGGTASNGASGPNLGVEFTSSALLLCLNTSTANCSNTSRGGVGISTSSRGALYFPSANPIMNVAAGFDTGFSGVFSAPFTSGTTVSIFDGLNGGGSLLASLVLGTTTNGGSNPNCFGAQYCTFENFSLGFSGVAKSVVFGGTVNQQVFDDLTFGSRTAGGGGNTGAVPEPSTWAMMLLGFAAVGMAMRKRAHVVTSVRYA